MLDGVLNKFDAQRRLLIQTRQHVRADEIKGLASPNSPVALPARVTALTIFVTSKGFTLPFRLTMCLPANRSQISICFSIELPRGNIRLQSGEESRLTPFVVQSKKFCVFREDSVFAIDVFPDHSFVKATNVEYASNASPENKTNLSADSYLVE